MEGEGDRVENPNKLFLIVSTGRRDLSEWVSEGGSISKGDGLSVTHSALREGLVDFSVTLDSPDIENFLVDSSVGGEKKHYLYPNKLDKLLSCLDKTQFCGAIFLGTNRTSGDYAEKDMDPRASHYVLAKWFAEYADLGEAQELRFTPDEDTTVESSKVWWSDFLINGENLENDKNHCDIPVARHVAQRIDMVLKFISERQEFNNATMILSHTGAMAEIKQYLLNNAIFRFPRRLVDLSVTEAMKNDDCGVLLGQNKEKLNPLKRFPQRNESIGLRAIVEQQLWQGDFLGAWSACVHYDRDVFFPDEGWILGVKLVADFFSGKSDQMELPSVINSTPCVAPLESLHRAIAELSSPDASGRVSESAIFQAGREALLRSAFKVEASLQATRDEERRYVHAIVGTCNFRDVALRGLAFRQLCTAPFNSIIDSDRLDYAEDKVPLFNGGIPAEWKTANLFQNKDDKVRIFDTDGITAWLDFLKKPTLYRFNKRIQDFQTGEIKSLAFYRNRATHRALSIDERISAIQNSISTSKKHSSLWNKDIPANLISPVDQVTSCSSIIGSNFLNQQYVMDVFREMEVEKPQERYQNMFAALIDVVRSPIYSPDS